VFAPIESALKGETMKIAHLPFYSIVSTSKDSQSRLVLFSHDKTLELWRLGRGMDTKYCRQLKKNVGDTGLQTQLMPLQGEAVPLLENHLNLLSLKPKIGGNIVCSGVSPNGVYIACSDRNAMKLYELTYTEDNKISVQTIALPPELKPAYRLAFTSDSNLLVTATFDFTVQIFNLQQRVVEDEFLEHRQIDEGMIYCIVAT
jgi:WD40 repeat protein